jgi:hypothetical protein
MWWQDLGLLTTSLPSSFLAALKCRRQAHHCLRWCMGCFELRKGRNLLSGFAATRSRCKAHSEGWEIRLKHSLSYKAVWNVFARDSLCPLGAKHFNCFILRCSVFGYVGDIKDTRSEGWHHMSSCWLGSPEQLSTCCTTSEEEEEQSTENTVLETKRNSLIWCTIRGTCDGAVVWRRLCHAGWQVSSDALLVDA